MDFNPSENLRMKRCVAASILAATLVTATDTLAAELPMSSRVRVRTHDSRVVTGTVMHSDGSALTLSVENQSTRVVAFRDIAGLQVSHKRKSQKTKWALLGTVPWAIVMAAVLADGGTDESGVVSPQSALLLGGGIAGGLVIGSRKRTDVWETAPIPSTITHSFESGVRVGIRLTF